MDVGKDALGIIWTGEDALILGYEGIDTMGIDVMGKVGYIARSSVIVDMAVTIPPIVDS